MQLRPNVAALIINPAGRLLICERWTIRGAWQFPQGGVDKGETLLQALHREVLEEVGFRPEHYDVIESKGGYSYLYPESIQIKKAKKHGYQGQEQTYFLCHLKPGAPEVNVDQTPREFRGYRWIRPLEFQLAWLPEFKHHVYRKVLRDFFQIIV